MNYSGQVTYFNSTDHSYMLNFSLLSERTSILNGSAHIRLKIGDTRILIHNTQNYFIDGKIYRYLKLRFLETIYNYNVSRTANSV